MSVSDARPDFVLLNLLSDAGAIGESKRLAVCSLPITVLCNGKVHDCKLRNCVKAELPLTHHDGPRAGTPVVA